MGERRYPEPAQGHLAQRNGTTESRSSKSEMREALEGLAARKRKRSKLIGKMASCRAGLGSPRLVSAIAMTCQLETRTKPELPGAQRPVLTGPHSSMVGDWPHNAFHFAGLVGRVTPCAAVARRRPGNGAHGVTRPTSQPIPITRNAGGRRPCLDWAGGYWRLCGDRFRACTTP